MNNLSDPQNLPNTTTMDEILQELRALREEVRALQLGSPPSKQPCKGVTGKGTPCRNSSQPGHEYCRMHGDRPPKPVKVPRERKPPKPKKIQPEHTCSQPGVLCILCETHGDVLDPTLPEAEFEAAGGLEDHGKIYFETNLN